MIQQSPTEERADSYLIRKGGAYYRPNAQGYTRCKHEAGRYTLAEAIRHSYPNGMHGPRDGIDYVHVDDMPDEYGAHMSHCDQGDYEGSCKYGDDNCPALASQTAQPAEADGWVMVPREPTEEMIFRGFRCIDWDRSDQMQRNPDDKRYKDGSGEAVGTTPGEDVRDAWHAMIAATPKAPTSTAEEVERIARAIDRDLWSDDPHKAHKAASPHFVSYARQRSLERAKEVQAALATPPAPNDDLRAVE